MYRRLAEINTRRGIDDMQAELTDRFGELPRAVRGLLFQLHVKILAQNAHVVAIASENGQISIRLPYLATTDRQALQNQLGHDVRVSRTAVRMPFDSSEETPWPADPLPVLEKLQLNPEQATANGKTHRP